MENPNIVELVTPASLIKLEIANLKNKQHKMVEMYETLGLDFIRDLQLYCDIQNKILIGENILEQLKELEDENSLID